MKTLLNILALAALVAVPATTGAFAQSPRETAALQQVTATPSNAGRLLRKATRPDPVWGQVNQTVEPVHLVEAPDVN